MSKTTAPAAPTRLRCAIYTRKSSEEGLDQSFNSLHAQRDACEAYVLSQTGEGWVALPTIYDDGGFSGGNMERPALKQLLADITAGRIDTVVVYKIDRLTRSLADFAKIVEIFDAKAVSFVSVTQSFNTTTSMGRLTLNMLLSFAQFEREVTGERIRDKIAASKARGMWMGGCPPLGYDLPTDLATRALVVNPAEAETVRLIFRRYLELGSVHEVMHWLDAQAIRSKAWTTRAGRAMGGLTFSRGALFHLMKNRGYLGEIVHGDKSYPGAHPAIVDPDVFAKVQTRLASQTKQRRERPAQVSTMPLKGLLFDAGGSAMIPTFTHGTRSQVYRYYVSAPLQLGGRRDPDDEAIRRIPAKAIEDLVRGLLMRMTGRDEPPIKTLVARVEVHARTVQILVHRRACLPRPTDSDSEMRALEARLRPDETIALVAADETLARIVLRCRLKISGGRIRVTDAAGKPLSSAPRIDDTLITALRGAHAAIAQAAGISIGTPENAIYDLAPSSPYVRNLMRLAYLAPDIQAQILEGRQPVELTRQRLVLGDIPPAWADQRLFFETT